MPALPHTMAEPARTSRGERFSLKQVNLTTLTNQGQNLFLQRHNCRRAPLNLSTQFPHDLTSSAALGLERYQIRMYTLKLVSVKCQCACVYVCVCLGGRVVGACTFAQAWLCVYVRLRACVCGCVCVCVCARTHSPPLAYKSRTGLPVNHFVLHYLNSSADTASYILHFVTYVAALLITSTNSNAPLFTPRPTFVTTASHTLPPHFTLVYIYNPGSPRRGSSEPVARTILVRIPLRDTVLVFG
jgi:hypothetical protein